VGKIVTHRLQNNLRDHCGVIVGWHYKYDPMFFFQLTHTNIYFPFICLQRNIYMDRCGQFSGGDQPHYIILIENNEICYVPQSMNICSILI